MQIFLIGGKIEVNIAIMGNIKNFYITDLYKLCLESNVTKFTYLKKHLLVLISVY